MNLHHCNQQLEPVDKDKGEYLCRVCGHTFFVRERAPEKKANVDAQELVGRAGCIVGILAVIASCNWILSFWK